MKYTLGPPRPVDVVPIVPVVVNVTDNSVEILVYVQLVLAPPCKKIVRMLHEIAEPQKTFYKIAQCVVV